MSFLSAPFQDWSPLLFILLAGALPTQVWRWAGAILSRSMDENSEFLKWVKAVATALVAGLIAKLVIYPSGFLADVPLVARISAMAIGYIVFWFTGPGILTGILAAEAVLVGAALFAF